jgi:hypothetical protein
MRRHIFQHGVPDERTDFLDERGDFLRSQHPKAGTKEHASHSGERPVRLLIGGPAHFTPLPAAPTRKRRVFLCVCLSGTRGREAVGLRE